MVSLVGTILWLLGWEFLKALSFPIAFLLFAIPFPGLDTMVALPLRYLMSHLGVMVLNTIGIPVVLSGTGILSAPDPLLGQMAGQKFAVDVANPCSGIRSLFALMMVGALFAHFTLRGVWRKWALFLCTPPLAVLGNLARILMLTIGTVAYLVFIVALLGMMGAASRIGRIGMPSSVQGLSTEIKKGPDSNPATSEEDPY